MDKTLNITGTENKITVGKMMCLGLNYTKHIDEMASKRSSEPVVFTKPATALLKNKGTIVIPTSSQNVHHEVELVAVIGREGKHIPAENAFDYVLGYALGLDITLRDLQSEAKKKGRPWALSKGFDTSAPVTDIIPKEKVNDPENLDLKLWVNDDLRQSGNTRDMIFKLDEVIAYLSTFFTLEPGDLIFTGTPEGVGQLLPGDKVKATIGDLATLECNVEKG